ncbi:hypothetical protein [Sphingobium sp. Sx8-8]|uniref:hypothetical protein n=1 Tax=Sphingobium sp. Sx8-8 TaxID=2933617 RepID=UPI001F5AE477|nr:hypothetical protein [Sphingobium sp. Sx8-8]
MTKARWLAGTVMAVALLAGGVPAQAQYQPRQSTAQDQDDLAQPPADEAQDTPDRHATPPRADDDFSDVVAQDQQSRATSDPRSERYGRSNDAADAAPQDRPDEQQADELTTSCALAARDEAEHDGGYAEVRQMQQPRETRNGFDVEGDVEVRSGWRAQDGTMRHFTCSVQNGRIADVYFQRDRAAR